MEVTPISDDNSWRERLLSSLKDCGVQRAPRHPIWNNVIAIVVILLTILIARLLAAGINDLSRGPEGPMAIVIGYPLLFIFAIGVLARVRNLFLRRAWQSSAKSAEKELSQTGSRRPILYLRSFRLDQTLARRSWIERYLGTVPIANGEQMVTSLLRRLGPVIAIGRPSEKLPALGAARFYVAHDRWQEKVADVAKESQLVLWATGVTEGLRWEISHLIETLHPERLILWAHPSLVCRSPRKREEEWQKFLQTLGPLFPKPLPEKLGDVRFFIFDSDWNPTPVRPNYWKFLSSRQLSSLQNALKLKQLEPIGGFGFLKSKTTRYVLSSVGICIGVSLLLSILGMATPKVCRLWGLGSFGIVPFTLLSIGFGLGTSLIIGGLASLFRKPLKLTRLMGLGAVVAALYAIIIPTLGVSIYWRAEENDLWNQAQTNPSVVQFYAYVPSRYKRPEAYEFLTQWLERRAANRANESDLWLNDDIERLIKEIDGLSGSGSDLKQLTLRLQSLLLNQK